MKNQLRIHSVSLGDNTIEFDVAVAEEVSTARDTFGNALAEGFFAYVIDPVTKQSMHVTEFDPGAALTVMHGPMAGG